MRQVMPLLAFFGMVGAALFWPHSTSDPPPAPVDAPVGKTAFSGRVTSHGFPVRARIEIRRTRALSGPEGVDGFARVLFPRGEAPGPPLRVVSTDPDGSYRVEGLPTGDYRLRISGPDGIVRRAGHRSTVIGEAWAADFEIDSSGREVHGRAVWSDGSPFRGRVVFSRVDTVTDEDGRFRLAGMTASAGHITLREAGRISRGFEVPEDGDLELTVDEGLTVREGRVTAAGGGNPVGGAFVFGHGPARSPPGVITGTFTDHEGRFRLLLSPGGTVRVSAPGYLVPEATSPPPGLPVAIRLKRCPVLTGVVRNAETGFPVPGVAVFVPGTSRRRSLWFYRAHGSPVLTDARGRFRIESPIIGDVIVAVAGAGFVSRDIGKATDAGYDPLALTLAAGDVRQLTLEVVPAPSVTGRVLDHEGRPVVGIRVTPRAVSDRDPMHWSQTGPALHVPPAATDADGRFHIPTLLPGFRYVMEVRPRNGEILTVDPLGPGPMGEIRLQAPWKRWTVVRVVETDSGLPIPGAIVTVGPTEETKRPAGLYLPTHFDRGRTGRDGRVRLGPLPETDLVLTVTHDEHVRAARIPVTSDPQEVGVARGGLLAGQVLLPDGSPAAGSWIEIPGLDLPIYADGCGRFRRRDIPPGPHRLRVRTWSERVWYTATTTVETGREDVVVTLSVVERRSRSRGKKTVEVRIEDREGRPVPKGTVEFLSHDARFPPGYLYMFGFRVPFTAGCTSHRPAKHHRRIWIRVRPADRGLGPTLAGPFPTDAGTVTVTLHPARRIAGTVLGPDDRGVRGVRVFARPVNGDFEEAGGRTEWHGAAYTDDTGRFAIRGVGRGPYRLDVAGPGRLHLPSPVEVDAGEDDVRIRMLPAATPTVTVLHNSGRPFVGVVVHAHRPGELSPFFPWDALTKAVTDSEGRAVLGSLDPKASYALVLRPPGDFRDVEEEEIPTWTPGNGTFRLSAIRVIRGRVRERSSGQPVGGAALWWRAADRSLPWTRISVGDDGTFAVKNVPWKPLVLQGGARDAYLDAPGNVELPVAVDGDDIEVRVKGGETLTVRIREWPDYPNARATIVWRRGWFVGSFQRTVPRNGVFRVHGLSRADSWTFHTSLPDGRMVHGTNLATGREQVLDLRWGKEIHVRVLRSVGGHNVKVGAYGNHLSCRGVRVRPGEFVISGLPDGDYRVRAEGVIQGTTCEGRASCRAGDRVSLVLAPK